MSSVVRMTDLSLEVTIASAHHVIFGALIGATELAVARGYSACRRGS
jgi:hypothetical protein